MSAVFPENSHEIGPIFREEEEVVGQYAYQKGILSPEELDRLRSMDKAEDLVPGFGSFYAVKESGKTTILDGPTRIAEREFPTKIIIKEPGFVALALAKVRRQPAFITAEKRRALHAV